MKVYNKLCMHFIGYELGIRSVCTCGLCPELHKQCDVCTEVGINSVCTCGWTGCIHTTTFVAYESQCTM